MTLDICALRSFKPEHVPVSFSKLCETESPRDIDESLVSRQSSPHDKIATTFSRIQIELALFLS